jgi:hypothetical protein
MPKKKPEPLIKLRPDSDLELMGLINQRSPRFTPPDNTGMLPERPPKTQEELKAEAREEARINPPPTDRLRLETQALQPSLFEFASPATLVDQRKAKIIETVQKILTIFQVDLFESIVESPELDEHFFVFDSQYAPDTINLVVRKVKEAGWQAHYEPEERKLTFVLPAVPLLDGDPGKLMAKPLRAL